MHTLSAVALTPVIRFLYTSSGMKRGILNGGSSCTHALFTPN